MSFLKKILAVCLAFSILISLSSCGENKYAQNGGQGGGLGNKPGGSNNNSQLDDDPSNDFSVQLVMNDGRAFVPTVSVDVYWSDEYNNVHMASVDETGRAVIDGLDGDYRVTLSSPPPGYTYNPNGNVATNDNRNITIIMYELNNLRGSGINLYSCYQINEIGIYSVTITNPGEMIFIEFSPQLNGVYTVESWANIVDDEVSPICMAYYGHSNNKYGEHRVTDVGLCGSYTRNFLHTVKIADENISVGGGSQSFTFAVTAETKSGVYPVKLTFAVKRNGSFNSDKKDKELMVPTHDWTGFDFAAFEQLAQAENKEIVHPEKLYGNSTDTYVFDENDYKIWPVSEGGDGVYHVYNPEKYPETKGYGPILFAYIDAPFRFSPYQRESDKIQLSFVDLDGESNALTVNGQYNYRLFIRGYESLARAGYYCASDCLCHALDGSIPACLAGCGDCKAECVPCPAEEMGIKGYAEYANSDGVVPVTEELKEFLQRYVSYSYSYFLDGEGSIEKEYNIHSNEASQWLFACGYYADK